MREISATLLAAARSLRGVPFVSLDVHDGRDRWRAHFVTGEASHRCDQVCVRNTWMLRVRSLNGHQGLQAATIYDPEASSNWPGSWFDVHGRCVYGSDVALGVVGDKISSTRARAYCFWEEGGVRSIQCVESPNGYSFGAPEMVTTGVKVNGWLAADHEAVFYQADDGKVKLWRKPAGGGAWSGSSYDLLGTLKHAHGLAACYLAGANLYYLLVAADGRLYAGGWNPAGDSWFPPEQLAPGGAGAAGSGVVLREPSLVRAHARWYATWVEAVNQGGGWEQPVACSASTWPHFGNETALALGGAGGSARAALAHRPATASLFAGDETSGVRRLDYLPGHAAQNVTGLVVGAYERRTREAGSELTVRVDNRGGAWSDWGQAGAAGEALQPHAAAVLRRGYRTAEGVETVALDPHYLVGIAEETGEYRGWLRLRAVDGWGLLGYWRAAEPLTWEGRSVGWLLAHLTARAGLAYGSVGYPASLGETVARFTVVPGRSAADAVAALLWLAGCGARWDAEGTLRVGTWAALGAGRATVGEQGELLWAEREQRAPAATSFLVYGEGAMGRQENATVSMALGLRARAARVEARAGSQALADAAVAGWRARGDASGWALRARLPLRPELELWDTMTVAGWAGDWRVRGLAERYEAEPGVYEVVVEGEG